MPQRTGFSVFYCQGPVRSWRSSLTRWSRTFFWKFRPVVPGRFLEEFRAKATVRFEHIRTCKMAGTDRMPSNF
jgi:hypothetical protein